LAVDAANVKAIKKLYQVKERLSRQPVHVIVPSIVCAKKIVEWNKIADRLAKKFWPGPLTIILELRVKGKGLRLLSAGTGTLGLRMPKNRISLDLARQLGSPITTTSANPPKSKGGYDSYSAGDIIKQFINKKYQPDIIINAGKLQKLKPSTMVEVNGDDIQILRSGPATKNQIIKTLTAFR